jgi:hypothetical protein
MFEPYTPVNLRHIYYDLEVMQSLNITLVIIKRYSAEHQ